MSFLIIVIFLVMIIIEIIFVVVGSYLSPVE